jgi:hypothetical protein
MVQKSYRISLTTWTVSIKGLNLLWRPKETPPFLSLYRHPLYIELWGLPQTSAKYPLYQLKLSPSSFQQIGCTLRISLCPGQFAQRTGVMGTTERDRTATATDRSDRSSAHRRELHRPRETGLDRLPALRQHDIQSPHYSAVLAQRGPTPEWDTQLSSTCKRRLATKSLGVYSLRSSLHRARRPIHRDQGQGAAAPHLEQADESAVTWATSNQLHDPISLSAKMRYMARMITKAIRIQPRPNNMNREDGRRPSRLWKTLIHSLKGRGEHQ